MPRKDEAQSGELASPTAVAVYIATLTAELAELARRNGFDALAYILQMARLEADQIARHSNESGEQG